MGGRRLKAPAGRATRPTSERVREAVFSILGPPPDDAVVLDLFAGAGALGLEALSRGAEHAVFADSSRAAIKVLRDNIASLDVRGATRVHPTDALRALSKLPGPFHWIFIDPPYATDLASRALEHLGGTEQLAEDGVIVVEHDRRNAPEPGHGCLVRTDCRRYGDTEVSFYQRTRSQ
jgi:16S rRNA (guanine(966)-N(2))-methyltransferase RsmD